MTTIETIPGVGVKSERHVRVTWAGAHRFDGGPPDGPRQRMDSSGETGPSPVDTLLNALAGCTGVDVVDILAKRRTPVESLVIDVAAARADAIPSRVIGVHLTFHVSGAGIDRVHAERAIELAVTKYCSVRDSLDPNLPVRWTLVLNGEAGAATAVA